MTNQLTAYQTVRAFLIGFLGGLAVQIGAAWWILR